MPYQIKNGSFLIVAHTLPAAIKLYDDMRNESDDVSIRDMDGVEINIDRVRRILNEGELS